MNRKSLIAALSLAAAAGTVSAESYTEHTTPFVSTAARVAVQARDLPATSSTANPWSSSYNPAAGFRSDRARAQVTADFLQHRDLVSALTGEDSGSGYLAGRPAAAGERFTSAAGASRIVR